MTRESAARFSFLLSTPAIGAAAAKALYDMHKHGGLHGMLNTDFLVGVAVSAITGCLVIAWFLHYLRRGRLAAVCVLSHCFWHNSACSGFHPPASVMKLLSPTQHRRLNEIVGFLLLSLGLVMLLSLVSYHTQDPSLDTAAAARPLNLVGYPGSYLSDLFFQMFGAAAFLFPLLTFLLSWKWIRSEELQAGGVKIFGSILLTLALSAGLSFAPLAPVRRHHPDRRHARSDAGQLPGGFAQPDRRAAGHAHRDRDLASTWFRPLRWRTRRLARRSDRLVRARADAWRAWRERAHQRAVEKAKAEPPRAAPPVDTEAEAAPRTTSPRTAQDRTQRVAPLALRRRWPRAMGDRRGSRSPRNTPAWKSPRRDAEHSRHRRRDPHLPGGRTRARARPRSPPCCPPRTATPHRSRTASTRSSACRPPTCSTRPPRAIPTTSRS